MTTNSTNVIANAKQLYELIRKQCRQWNTTRVHLSNQSVCEHLGILPAELVEAEDLMVSAKVLEVHRRTSKSRYTLPAYASCP